MSIGTLVIQVPCLNEEQTLQTVLDSLPRHIDGVKNIQILVIDDGSSDETYNIAKRNDVDHIIRHRTNRGLAAAFSHGIDFALHLGADIIVNTDGDNQYPGDRIVNLIEPIVNGSADVVIGNRQPERDARNSYAKRFLYFIGRILVSFVIGKVALDPVSGFRAFSRQAAISTHICTKYSYTLESLVQLSWKGYLVKYVPIVSNVVTRPSRLFRSQLHFVVKSGLTLLRVLFMYYPFHALLTAAMLFSSIGCLPIFRFAFLFVIGRGNGHVQSIVLGGGAIVIGGMLFVTAFMADLISQNRFLLESEVEQRKRSLMSSRCNGADEHQALSDMYK